MAAMSDPGMKNTVRACNVEMCMHGIVAEVFIFIALYTLLAYKLLRMVNENLGAKELKMTAVTTLLFCCIAFVSYEIAPLQLFTNTVYPFSTVLLLCNNIFLIIESCGFPVYLSFTRVGKVNLFATSVEKPVDSS